MANNRFTPQIVAVQAAPMYFGQTVTDDGIKKYTINKMFIDDSSNVHFSTSDGSDVKMDDIKCTSEGASIIAVRYDNTVYYVDQCVSYKKEKSKIVDFDKDLNPIVLVSGNDTEDLDTASWDDIGLYAVLTYTDGSKIKLGDTIRINDKSQYITGKVKSIEVSRYDESGIQTVYNVILQDVCLVSIVDGELDTTNLNTYNIELATGDITKNIVKK